MWRVCFLCFLSTRSLVTHNCHLETLQRTIQLLTDEGYESLLLVLGERLVRAEFEGVVVVPVLGRDLGLALVLEAAVEVVRPAAMGEEIRSKGLHQFYPFLAPPPSHMPSAGGRR